MIEWFSLKNKENYATIDKKAITFSVGNKEVLDSAYSVMLGVDLEKKEIHVRILNADLANRGDIPIDFQNHVSVGKSYARITNKSFIESLIESGLIDLESVTQRKFVTKFDKNNNTIIIELGRGM
ncbi:MAG: hypothetical protein SOV26_01760 [Candidatus Onthovivens sp.]|nr:hypothetical protein [Candidatus Onthovivens sp.]